MEKTEYRFCEVRREGARTGLAGQSPTETWRASAHALSALYPVRLAHSRAGRGFTPECSALTEGRVLARSGGGGLVITDDTAAALEVRAELPETRESDDTLALVEAKILRGFSWNLSRNASAWKGRVRVLVQARLVGLAVVDKPAYRASTIAARAEVETPNRGGGS